MERKLKINGYFVIPARNSKNSCKSEYEHRVVAENVILHRKLKNGEVVHHLNGNKCDNSPDNLIVITSDDHSRAHSYIKSGDVITRESFVERGDGSYTLKPEVLERHTSRCSVCGKVISSGHNICPRCLSCKLYSPISKEFVDKVKKEIASSSVSSVARRTGVSDRTVVNWVTGKRKFMIPGIQILPNDPKPIAKKVISDESREKISESLKRYWDNRPSPNDVPIVELNSDGSVASVYRSGRDAERKSGLANSRINSCINGNRKTYRGKFWCKFDAYTEFDYRKTESDFEFITDTDNDFNS